MASAPDELIVRLLQDVALAGPLGLGADELAKAVRDFYDSQRVHQRQRKSSEDDELLFSARPLAKPAAVDDRLLDAVWGWLSKQPEVEIRELEPASSGVRQHVIKASNAGDASHGNARSLAVSGKHAEKRIFTAESRVWHSIAGHGVDHKRISPLEFTVLSVIAAAGPAGILQPEVTRLTGQDKRSLPKRTDSLAEKGYITKESVLGAGTRTSVLTLRKYAHSVTSSQVYRGKQQANGSVAEKPVIFYDRWFDEIIRLLKANDNIATYEDVRRELGIHKKRYETKALFRCIRRLARAGCLDKLKARIDDGSGAGSSAQWMRCIRLLREPTELDRMNFVKSDYWNRKLLGPRALDHEKASPATQDGEVLDDDYDVSDDEDSGDDPEMFDQRVPPQWTPDRPMTNQIFDMIDAAGTEGITSVDLHKRMAAMFWRRPLDEVLARLSDSWQSSQPPYLRHRAVLKDTAVRGKQLMFVYRSMTNFEKAVEAGEANWNTVHGNTAGSNKGKKRTTVSELGTWGFAKLKPSLFAGRDGRATLKECKSAGCLEALADDGPELVVLSPTKSAGPRRCALSSTRAVPPDDKEFSQSKPASTTRRRRLPATTLFYHKSRAATVNDDAKYTARARATAERLVRAEMKLTQKRNADEAGLDLPFPVIVDMLGTKSPDAAATETPAPSRFSRATTLQEGTISDSHPTGATESSASIEPSLVVKLPVDTTAERLATAPCLAKKPRVEASTSAQSSESLTPAYKKRGRPSKAVLAERERLQKKAEQQSQDQTQAIAVAEILKARVIERPALSLLTPQHAENSLSSPKPQPPVLALLEAQMTSGADAAKQAPNGRSESSAELTMEGETRHTDCATRTVERQSPAPPLSHRKRRRDQDQVCVLPEDRIKQLDAELVARSWPGAYINPPGAKDLKANTLRRTGRPKNALIAVIRSEKLREYVWFQPDVAHFPSQPSLARISRTSWLGSSHSLLPAAKRKRGKPRQRGIQGDQTPRAEQGIALEPSRGYTPASETLFDTETASSPLGNAAGGLTDGAERDQVKTLRRRNSTIQESPPRTLTGAAQAVSGGDQAPAQAAGPFPEAAQDKANPASSESATTITGTVTVETITEHETDKDALENDDLRNSDAHGPVLGASKESSVTLPVDAFRKASVPRSKHTLVKLRRATYLTRALHGLDLPLRT